MFQIIKIDELISLDLKCKRLSPSSSINEIVQFIQECAMRRGHLTTLFNSIHQSQLLENRLNSRISLKQICCNKILDNQKYFEFLIDKIPNDLFEVFLYCAIYKLKVASIKVCQI
jgi:hypothetical protein